MTETQVLLGSLTADEADITRWAEDDDPEAQIGEDAGEDMGGEDA
jgi:hypothetical protein